METAKHKNVGARAAEQAQLLTTAELQPVEDLSQYLRTYARQKPEMAALWCFGIGFIVGWKLKPW